MTDEAVKRRHQDASPKRIRTLNLWPIAGTAGQTFDVIIVGGGSAGAALAARLSADSQCRVLLVEAGENFAPDSYPPVLMDANIVAGSPTFDWQYHTEDRVVVASIDPFRLRERH